MFPILQIGPLAFPLAPLLVVFGVFIGASLVERHAARLELDQVVVSNMVYLALAGTLVGARVGYVLEHIAAYSNDPFGILAPTPVTLDPIAGLVLGGVVGGVYARRHHLPLWRTLDSLAPGIAALGIALGMAHLASGDAYGAPARLPWSIYLWDESRHPSQVYEIVAAAIILLIWSRIRNVRAFDGFQFWVVLALFAASIVLLEAFRGDSVLYRGWRVAQVAALAALAAALSALRLLGSRAPVPESERGVPP